MYHGASKDDSQDIVQDLYERLLRIQAKEGNIDRIFYKGKVNMVYLFNAIRNRTFNHLRDKKKTVAIDDETYLEYKRNKIVSPDDTLLESDVDNILLKMGPYYHKLYDAYIKNDISMRGLAEATTISLTTIFYGVKHIREILKPICYGTEPKNDTKRENGVEQNTYSIQESPEREKRLA